MRFGLKDVTELPSMDEFEKIASELEETAPAAESEGETNAAYEAEGAGGPELDENAPEEPDNDSLRTVDETAATREPISESNEKIAEPAE